MKHVHRLGRLYCHRQTERHGFHTTRYRMSCEECLVLCHTQTERHGFHTMRYHMSCEECLVLCHTQTERHGFHTTRYRMICEECLVSRIISVPYIFILRFRNMTRKRLLNDSGTERKQIFVNRFKTDVSNNGVRNI
jgi:hypothetical protein